MHNANVVFCVEEHRWGVWGIVTSNQQLMPKGAFTPKAKQFFARLNPMKSQRTDACGCDWRDIFLGAAFGAFGATRLQFSPELKYFNFEASSRNSGQSALEFRSRSAGSGSLSDGTVTSSEKVTELSEPTGDVMNPNTRVLVCGMSKTSIKQN